MKVFVSWSGDVSHGVAQALKGWLPNVIQAVQVFLSSDDIAKGSHWFHELSLTLDECDFGILCLTKANCNAPWILYEAGALGKRFENAHIVPLLVDLGVDGLAGPLAQLNACALDRDEIRKMVETVNAQLGDSRLTDHQLNTAFNAYWPDLENAVQTAIMSAGPVPTQYRYDVFLSTPMAAYSSDEEYGKARSEFKKVFDALVQSGLSVYWAAEKIVSISDFDTLDVSALDDLKALDESCRFVLVYPQTLASSALFEAGYALATNRFSHYFVRVRDDLPFLMRELSGLKSQVRIHTERDWKDFDDLAQKITKYNQKWFSRAETTA